MRARLTQPGQMTGPLTLGFCILLSVIYLVSALPGLSQPQPGTLWLTNLDTAAVIREQQYWRLLTAHLIHLNSMHIGLNVFSLWIFGNLLEARLPWPAYLLLMLISILGTDLASIYFDVPHSVGASGIVYGYQSTFIILAAKEAIVSQAGSLGKTLQSLAGYLLLMIAVNLFNAQGINIYGHLGGGVAGFLAGLCLSSDETQSPARYIGLLVLLTVFCGLLFGLILPG